MGRHQLDKWTQGLLSLFPQGAAWNKELDSNFSKLIEGTAHEFVRLENETKDLIKEFSPSGANYTLDAWEDFALRNLDCSPYLRNDQGRREQILSMLRARGGQSKEHYESIFESLGLVAEVVDFKPFRMGSRMGERIFTTAVWAFSWGVKINDGDVLYFRMGSRMGERLREFKHPFLRCLLDRMKLVTDTVLIFPSGSGNV